MQTIEYDNKEKKKKNPERFGLYLYLQTNASQAALILKGMIDSIKI